jgi:A/G-specific adenine glycosylase
MSKTPAADSRSRSLQLWKQIAVWYRSNGRDLPWRNIDDPYRIVVSEFMLQQTQVDRVVPSYRRFIASFPSWKKLASTPQATVVRAWKGLGYNMRAVRLKKLAEVIVTRHDGRLPEDRESLLSLKGIGPYTARAIGVFAFRQRSLAPDTNLRRVLTRVFQGPTSDPKAFDEKVWSRWEKTLQPKLAYDVNQGLMDLGATICKAGRPLCGTCPLQKFCRSYPRILLHGIPYLQKKNTGEKVDSLGVPNRITRGRIVDFLRRRRLLAKDIDVLGKAVRGRFEVDDREWLNGVLSGLEKDGLIELKDSGWGLA